MDDADFRAAAIDALLTVDWEMGVAVPAAVDLATEHLWAKEQAEYDAAHGALEKQIVDTQQTVDGPSISLSAERRQSTDSLRIAMQVVAALQGMRLAEDRLAGAWVGLVVELAEGLAEERGVSVAEILRGLLPTQQLGD